VQVAARVPLDIRIPVHDGFEPVSKSKADASPSLRIAHRQRVDSRLSLHLLPLGGHTFRASRCFRESQSVVAYIVRLEGRGIKA
jgi:hypothetical protein